MKITMQNLKGQISNIACVCGHQDFFVRDPENKTTTVSAATFFICQLCGTVLPSILTKKIHETYFIPAEKVIVP